MKKWLFGLLSVMLVVTMIGCGDEQNITKTSGDEPWKNDQTITLQGTIMDAVTGEHLGGNDLQMWLIQGTSHRTPSKLIKNESLPLVGEYAFTNIPVGVNTTDMTFKVIVVKDGYQRFEAEISYAQALANGYRDENQNAIGNIYLFPVDTAAPDYSYQVTFNDAPVAGATVLFMPQANNNLATTQTGSTLTASLGYVETLSAVSDANGYVTFSGAALALGAQYQTVVLPVSFEGVSLAQNTDVTVIAGLTQTVDDIIAMTDLVPGNNMYGLYVTSISNANGDEINTAGQLTIQFSRPVTLTTTDFDAVESSPTGILNVDDTVAGTQDVFAALSADGLSLTLTPSWATTPDAGENNTSIFYGTGGVSVVGYPDSEFNVFNLVDANGDLISGTVNMTGP